MEKIKSKIEIPGKAVGLDVDSTREQISKLMSRLVSDDKFRAEINKDPVSTLKGYGIELKEDDIENLKNAQLTKLLEGMAPPNQLWGVALAVVIVLIIPGDTR